MSDRPQLDLDGDGAFETGWKVIQKAWMVMLSLFVGAGLVGLLGRGPLSNGAQPLPGGLGKVSYERIARNNTPGQLAVEWRGPVAGPSAEITLDNDLLGAVHVVATTPVASAYHVTPDGAAWSFANPSKGGGRVVFSIETFRFGPAHGRVTLSGRAAPLNIFVFP